MEYLELINKGINAMEFIIVSENREKIKKTLEGIFDIFCIHIDLQLDTEEEQNLIDDFIKKERISFCVGSDFDVSIILFSHLGGFMRGTRAQFIFIDKDIEVTEDDFCENIKPVGDICNNANIFNEGKGYFLI